MQRRWIARSLSATPTRFSYKIRQHRRVFLAARLLPRPRGWTVEGERRFNTASLCRYFAPAFAVLINYRFSAIVPACNSSQEIKTALRNFTLKTKGNPRL
jgi:hypothetical protein